MMVDSHRNATPTLWICRASILIGWAAILTGLTLVVGDCAMWLRTEVWHPWSLADLWGRLPLGGDPPPSVWQDMRGLHLILHKVMSWCGRVPISLMLLILGCAIAWRSSDAHDRAERALSRRRGGEQRTKSARSGRVLR
ncbi:hypothetical protein I3A86_26620 [Salmonella enterica]|nr:hypothetical protein [Salmonella enterica]